MFASVSASLNRKKRIDAVRRVGNSPFGGVTVSLPGRSCLHRKSTGSRVYVEILFLFLSFLQELVSRGICLFGVTDIRLVTNRWIIFHATPW